MMKNAPGLETFCGCRGIGIDVSKATLEVVGLAGDAAWRMALSNNEAAIAAFAQVLQGRGYSGTLVCEATIITICRWAWCARVMVWTCGLLIRCNRINTSKGG